MDQVQAMQIYLRVAELSSFTQAAHTMGLPKGSISQAVQRLENQLGTRLLHRTTRSVQMTQDGLAFYERCKDLLSDLDELQTMFARSPAALSGRLRVDLPSSTARNIVVPQLPAFLRAHPGLQMELSSTDRRVDVVSEGFDCVLRIGVLADLNLIARPLGHFGMANCVSRDYLKRHRKLKTLADLAHHQLIHYVPTLGGKSAGFEYQDEADGSTRFVAMPGALTVNNAEAYKAACLAGLGIIQVPEVAVRDQLAAGILVEVLPGHRAAPMPVSLLYAHRRQLPQRVQAFMDWLAAVMAPHLL